MKRLPWDGCSLNVHKEDILIVHSSHTLLPTNISHLLKRNIILPATFKGDMLVSWMVFLCEVFDGMNALFKLYTFSSFSKSQVEGVFFKSWCAPQNHWVNFTKTYSLSVYHVLGGGFKYVLIVTPKDWGRYVHFD